MTIDLPDAEQAGGLADPPEARRHGRRRWVAVALALAVLVATFGYLAGNEVQANTQFDQTHTSLDSTRHHIDTVLSDLSTVRHELAVVDSQVAAATKALAQDTTQLQGVKHALISAQVDVTSQSSTIGDLHTCLGGVEQALNALAVADQNHAIAALDAVQASCAKAVATDG